MRIIDGKKSAHSATHGNNRNRDLFDGILVKFKWAWDISKDGKHLELKYVPLKECYVESGLQGKSDRDLHALAGYYHRDFTTAAWNMCCKNDKVHGIWGSDDDVERAHEAAILPGYTKGDVDNPKRKYNIGKRKSDGNTLCALFK